MASNASLCFHLLLNEQVYVDTTKLSNSGWGQKEGKSHRFLSRKGETQAYSGGARGHRMS